MSDKITFRDLSELIFGNAKEDRDKALLLYGSAQEKIRKDDSNHVIIGPIIVKYLERSNKANDQLLALARLLQEYDPDMSMSEDEKSKVLDKIDEEIKRNNRVDTKEEEDA